MIYQDGESRIRNSRRIRTDIGGQIHIDIDYSDPTLHVLPPTHVDAFAASQETPSKVLIASKTQSIITRLQTSAVMTFSATVFSMEIKKHHVPRW
jgi:hypothetical protein